jgi:hypothetical protein
MATTPWQDSPPTVDELYEAAALTSDLTTGGGMVPVDPSIGKAAEVLGAAGMAAAPFYRRPAGADSVESDERQQTYFARRTGMALLRLATEWQAATKPRRPRLPTVEELAATMPQAVLRIESGRSVRGPDLAGATIRLARIITDSRGWYQNELRLLAVRLKSRAYVLEQVNFWAIPKGIRPDTVAEAVLYWLSPTCPTCSGHGFMKEPDKPVLSVRQCKDCHGTGNAPRPNGAGEVLNYLDEAVQKGRESLRKRLRKG